MRVDGILFAVVAEKLNACTHTVAGKKKKERHYLTLAAQYLNNRYNQLRGIRKIPPICRVNRLIDGFFIFNFLVFSLVVSAVFG